MTTIRVERRDRFTTVDRATVNDATLSFKARGLLIWLLDKPDGWRVRSDAIALATTEGRDSVRSALRELECAGYLTRTKCRDKRGRVRTETVVRETPGHTEDGFSGVGEPALVSRPSVSQAPFRRLRATTESAPLSTKKSTAGGQLGPRDYRPLSLEELEAMSADVQRENAS